MLERWKMERGIFEIVDTESLAPKEHLLRKIDAAVDFNEIYDMVEPLYCADNGRCGADLSHPRRLQEFRAQMRQGEDVCRIVAAGDFSPELYRDRAEAHPDAFVIAADAGYRYLHRLGVEPDLFVGDTDSLGFRPDGVPCVLLPSVKDDTDTISALREGLKRGFRRFEIFGALGGKRLSHSLANLQALLFLKERQADGVLIDEHCTVCALCGSGDRRTVAPNRFFSLFAATESAVVSIADAKYPLERHRLTSAFPLGASNESAAVPAAVTLVDGSVFLVIEPK